MTKDGAGSDDVPSLISSLFALIPIPVAIVMNDGRVVLSNSAFSDLFPGTENIQSLRHHELELPGHGVYELESVPLNDQMKIVYASEVTNEVQLRRQLVHLERMAAIKKLVSGVAHELN